MEERKAPTCPRNEFPRALLRVPALVPFLYIMDQSLVPPMVGISKCGHHGALSEAKEMTSKEERLNSISLDFGPRFLSM